MANVSSSNGIEKQPKLRFPEFIDPWEMTQLCNLFSKNTQKNSKGTVTNVISNSAKNGLIPQKDYFDKDIANADNTAGYYIISKNDFVYNPRKSTDAPYGPISRYTYDEDGIVSPLYLCFRGNNHVNPEYFERFFKSSVWHRYIYMSGDSGARHDRVSIKDETFFEMPIHMPNNEEQKKIAAFLSLIEQKIECQFALVENLKKYKRGVLQKLFAPKNVKWKRQRFGDFITEHSEKTSETNIYPICSLTVEDGIILKPERYYREFLITKEGDSYKILRDGWFAYNPMNAHIGAIAPNKLGKSVSVSGYYNIFSVKRSETNTFWEEFLKCYSMLCYYKVIATGSLIEKQRVHYSQFVDIELPLPSIEEQIKISSLLDALNRKLNNAESTYSNLKKLKAGILQKIFVE